MDILKTKLEKFPRIGKKYGAVLAKLNIFTVEDFLFHFPFRYENYTERVFINELTAKSNATIMGEITQSKLIRTWKKKMMITECFISDETGTVRAVWFNQPYISDSLVVGKGVRLSGKVSEDKNGLYFSNPSWERSSREPINTGRLVPIYPETEGLTSKFIRWQMQIIFNFLNKEEFEIPDPIEKKFLEKLHLPDIQTALRNIHFPKNEIDFEIARKRFAFQEMLILQLSNFQAKYDWEKNKAISISFDENLIKNFVENLPFQLTGSQKKASFQILKDLEKNIPMNRLLNGDVGSGKTMVAIIATLLVSKAGFQVALMAPTEVLARQHFESFCKALEKNNISVGLLTNSYQLIQNTKHTIHDKNISKTSRREYLLKEIKNGSVQIVIGTHALIQKDIKFKNLSLVIIDEQHRFGVSQRAFLQQQAEKINDGIKEKIPHLLTMTATPIPRTMAMAFMGNLNISILDEMPKNRKPIITEMVGNLGRKKTYDFISEQINSGRQAFVILPLVEESEKLSELKAATQEHQRLSKDIFPQFKIALLHGKMKSSEKEIIMEEFKNKKYDILVATSVVEVGIDIPNASVIIIEDADRFGLSQLHQFRGRVGRGEHQSYCFLFTKSSTAKTKSRLNVMTKTNSGFIVAQKDFDLRGPGEFLGTRQSGIPDIAMQHIGNIKLIEITQEIAKKILSQDRELKKHPLLKNKLEKFSTSVHLE